MEAGRTPGAEASLIKVEFSELMQRIEALALSVIGPAGLEFSEVADASIPEAIDPRRSGPGGPDRLG